MSDEELAGVRAIADVVERGKRASEAMEEHLHLANEFGRIRQEAIDEMRSGRGMTQADIAQALNLTRARVGQLLKAGPPPMERAVLAPQPGAPLTIAIVQKADGDQGQPSITLSTRAAVAKLEELAASMNLQTKEEPIAPPGIVDLNTDNLVALIGPRMSALIAQGITSDPVIHWRRDNRDHWYIVDSKTGTEYHSDFDNGLSPASDGDRYCIAHIGRIRRPDGQGSFLYLGGAHTAGTAGAVDVFVREYASIWDQAKRALWSAVVVTKASEKGRFISAEMASPLYVHGKR